MSDTSDSSGKINLETIQRLIKQAPNFHTLEGPQQAAYRAHLKRYLGRVKHPQVAAALQRVAEYIGESKAPYRGLTADDLLSEYRTKYSQYDAGRRGAFKAKVTRLMRSYKEVQDEDNARKLAGLQMTIREAEERDLLDSILDLAELIPSSPDNDSEE